MARTLAALPRCHTGSLPSMRSAAYNFLGRFRVPHKSAKIRGFHTRMPYTILRTPHRPVGKWIRLHMDKVVADTVVRG